MSHLPYSQGEKVGRMTRARYGSSNHLQVYDYVLPETIPAEGRGYWLIYIHGGYFRDPKVDSTSFAHTVDLLTRQSCYSTTNTDTDTLDTSYPVAQKSIAGYATINYRLSPHTSYPQPSDTPRFELNSARWPDHMHDVLSAISHLQQHHPSSKQYILAGHSVGATMAFLTALQAMSVNLVPPKLVLGVSGIYDFPAIHASSGYEFLTGNAMDKKDFERASPALYAMADYEEKWRIQKGERRTLLAHSHDDGLVPWEQVEEMHRLFAGESGSAKEGFAVELIELNGKHNEIWEYGELARAVEKACKMLQ